MVLSWFVFDLEVPVRIVMIRNCGFNQGLLPDPGVGLDPIIIGSELGIGPNLGIFVHLGI